MYDRLKSTMRPICLWVLCLYGLYYTDGFGTVSAPFRSTSLTARLELFRTTHKNNPPTVISTIDELNTAFSDKSNNFVSVQGDTQHIGSPQSNFVHPVAQLLHQRRREKSPLTPVDRIRPDRMKVALVIEGGGMRGCVTAGMVTALFVLGLEDTFDVIYGASAGTVIGAYFNTRQLPWFGPEIYYDSLSTAGNKFIDTSRMMRALGLGLLNPTLVKDVLVRRNNGKPVLNLDFLLNDTLQHEKPLNWEKFKDMQSVQPLKVVASALSSHQGSVVLDMERGSFSTLSELAGCMHASCLLPGIAGAIVNYKRESSVDSIFVRENGVYEKLQAEPLADALIYEPLPFYSAIAEGATHILVLRSRPDGVNVLGKASPLERMISKRFFRRKNKLQHIDEYMKKQLHKRVYAKAILHLNKASKDKRDLQDVSRPHIMPIAVPPGSPEITRLEMRRCKILDGVRRGFARTYDALVEDPKGRGRGMDIAMLYFPDEILLYDPLKIPSRDGTSAFERFVHDQLTNFTLPPKTASLGGLPI